MPVYHDNDKRIINLLLVEELCNFFGNYLDSNFVIIWNQWDIQRAQWLRNPRSIMQHFTPLELSVALNNLDTTANLLNVKESNFHKTTFWPWMPSPAGPGSPGEPTGPVGPWKKKRIFIQIIPKIQFFIEILSNILVQNFATLMRPVSENASTISDWAPAIKMDCSNH